MFRRGYAFEPLISRMHQLNPEDERTARLWTIRLTVACALVMLSLFAILRAGLSFDAPQATTSTRK